MTRVIVVPETEEFEKYVLRGEIWINANLGKPDLIGHDARYAAPYLLHANPRGVDRVYHITAVYQDHTGDTVIELGDSFVLNKIWDNMGQPRKFEYHDLADFGLKEIKDGLLERV